MDEPRDELDELVVAAVRGERHALDRVLRIVRPLAVNYCRARIGSQERSNASADDVAQEVCYAVIKALPSYRDQGHPFRAFVYGIAAHKVADARRFAARNKSEPMSELPDQMDVSHGPEQLAMNGALTEQMSKWLEVLPAQQREIVVLRVVAGLSAEETALAVGSTPGAVRVAQHRALQRLRMSMSPEEVF